MLYTQPLYILDGVGTMVRKPARSSKAAKAKPKAAARKAKAEARARVTWTKLRVDPPQPKQAISLRIDQDVLDWFRAGGAGYQSRINAVLRAFAKASAGSRRAASPRGR